MTRLVVPVVLVVAIGAGVFALAASGGSDRADSAGQATTGYSAPSRPAAPKAAIDVRTTSLGKILVDGDGRSLYLFEADKPNQSNCSGACLSAWPPLTADQAPAAGALPGKIGTIPAAGGKQRVTYDGRPLYLYAGDQKAGDTTGQELDQFGAEWYVVAPSGDKIDTE
jgi:predicted lipoprotein with Yx(FWY)xxD motif